MKKITISVLFIISLIFPQSIAALEISITGNGADSENVVQANVTTATEVTQTNNSEVSNSVDVAANTGGNSASGNTGNAEITTGNISSQTNIANSGNVSQVELGCCPTGNDKIDISGNGENSNNEVSLTQSKDIKINIFQEANINNIISGVTNTGNSIASQNGGDVNIKTGNITVINDLINGPFNLYSVHGGLSDPSIFVQISGNGASSNNKVTLNTNSNFNLYLNNLALINNVLNWNANTGGNSAKDNLGEVAIETGNIQIGTKITNGPINVGQVVLGCCPKPGKPDPGDGGQPSAPSNPSQTHESSSQSNSNGGGGSSGGEVLGAGEILPATGSWLINLLLLISGLMFALGLYLRLHPGQDPG